MRSEVVILVIFDKKSSTFRFKTVLDTLDKFKHLSKNNPIKFLMYESLDMKRSKPAMVFEIVYLVDDINFYNELLELVKEDIKDVTFKMNIKQLKR